MSIDTMMMRVEHVENRIEKELLAYLREKGYKSQRATFYFKETKAMRESISFKVVKIGLDFGVTYSIGRKYKVIEEYWEDLKSSINRLYGEEEYTVSFDRASIDPNLENKMGYSILEGGGFFLQKDYIDEEVKDLGKTFVRDYEKMFMPLLEQTDNLTWLDAHVNLNPLNIDLARKYIRSQIIYPKLMIIAKLSGNARYYNISAEIFKRCKEQIAATGDEYVEKELEVLLTVYNRLRGIEPLQNQMLSEQ